MSMIFCRGCGREIHETALSCPHCGGQQAVSAVPVASTGNQAVWMAVTSLVLGIFGLLIAVSEGIWTPADVVLELIFDLSGLAFGVISLSKQMAGKGIAITGVVLNALSLLILVGSV